MRVPRPRVPLASLVRLVLVLALVASSALLFSSSQKQVFTTQDKAYYADASMINWVRPGLVLKILTANIADDGMVKVRIRVTDPKTMPLDLNGINTPGPISVRFVIGTIPQGQTQYTSYIARTVASKTGNGLTATQATSDSDGSWEQAADGEYVYTFKSKVPAGFDKHATHSIGAWAARDLSEFDMAGIANQDSDVYTWVPDGSQVATTRDVVRTKACERCHDPLQAHGQRRGVELCIICHQPQSSDPDTGNTVDMPVMIHKIHAGSSLPSVKAGGKYQIIGHNQSVADFSTVVFPADVRNCTVCHDQSSGAAQAMAYLKPTKAACGACHDDVNFATGEGHLNLPQFSEKYCGGCHIPQGETEFDASILGGHVVPENSASLPGTTFNIVNVTNNSAGQKPTVTFTVRDKKGNGIALAGQRCSLVLAGPTSDYTRNVSEDVSKTPGSQDGTYVYTMKNAIPADAKGTYAIGIEGYTNQKLLAGTKQERAVRDAGMNVVKYFSVDSSDVEPRRAVVSVDKCNSCHFKLSLHGGNRNQIEQCVLCHNPNGTDAGSRPADKAPAQTIQFAYMIHRIHTGEASKAEYTIYGHGNSANDFTDIRFVGDRRNCAECHIDNPTLTAQLPLADGLQQVQSPRGVLNPMGPATAACTGCHTEVAAASHALSNTTDKLGEACAACHSTGHQFGVAKVHAR